MTDAKAKTIAESAMKMKKGGKLEPCYENMLAQCPSSTWNGATGRPFSRNTANIVLTTLCYDRDPNKPWEFRYAPRRKPLNDEQMVERAAWADRLRRANNDPS